MKKYISLWAGINIFLFAALRATTVGTDVASYSSAYMMLPYMSFKSIFTSTWLSVSRDPIFYTFMKVLTYISKDPQFMLIIISLVVSVSISIFIYRNSRNPLMSFIMFIGLRYYSFTLTGLRQAMAWSILMFSYEAIKERKLFKFITIICIASLFHKSAILFIPAYFFADIKRIDIISLIVVIGIFLNYVFNGFIINLFIKLPVLQQYEGYVNTEEKGTTGGTILFIYVVILVFVFIFRNRISKKDSQIHLMYNLSITGVGITFLAFSYANIFRIGYYFILPIILLLPTAIHNIFDKKLRMLINYLVIILLITQFILIGPGAGTENYQFFWQY